MKTVGVAVGVLSFLAAAGCSPKDPAPSAQKPSSAAVVPAAQPPSAPAPSRLEVGCPGCDILLLTVDTVRADELECGSRFEAAPRMCSLMREGVSFDQAMSPAPATIPVFSAIFTNSLISNEDSQEVLAHYEQTEYLAEKLTRLGYDTAGFTDHPGFGDYHKGRATPVDFKRGFTVFRNLGDGNGKLLARPLTDAVLDFLNGRKAAARPLFLWVHHFGPHFDYTPSLAAAQRFGYSKERCGRITLALEFETLRKWRTSFTPRELDCLKALHKAEVFETDEQLGRLLDFVDSSKRANKSVVISFADHGEEFMERGELGHELTLFEEQLHVPFLVRHPAHHRGERVSAPASTMLAHDLVLGVVKGASIEVSAQPVVSRTFHYYPSDDPSQMFRTTPNDFALRNGELKHVWNPTQKKAETFDLREDPGERQPLDASREKDTHALLVSWVDSHRVQGSLPSEEAKKAQLELMQRLQKLGYIQPE